MTMAELPIPMHIVVTGLKVGALKHELEYYEHFLDDQVDAGMISRANKLFKWGNLASIMRELASEPMRCKSLFLVEIRSRWLPTVSTQRASRRRFQA